MSLRQLPEIANIMPNPPEISPRTEELRLSSDPTKVLGFKRRLSESPSSTSSPRATSNYPATGHLVYVRRKLDSEGCKLGSCSSIDSASPNSRKPVNGVAKENEIQEVNQSRVSPSSASTRTPPSPLAPFLETMGKPMRDLVLPDPKDTALISITTKHFHVEPRNLDCHNYWEERFHRLQIFLENYDQSNQEDYIQMLRSLSAVGRSKHAVELEKRAIQLLLEEGKELHRMRVMNVLGKALPNVQTPISSTQTVPSMLVKFPKIDGAGDVRCVPEDR